MTKTNNIATALASAQLEMEGAKKTATNPHFKKTYADLASVIDACLPALNKHGIAVLQPPFDDGTGRYVKTIFIHGESGETLECRVPLIIGKDDMQGYGSASTYARRYGLMAMAGIAPEDDDGNAAVKAAPQTVSSEQFTQLRDKVEEWGGDQAKFIGAYGAQSLEQFPVAALQKALAALDKRISEKPDEGIDDDKKFLEGN